VIKRIFDIVGAVVGLAAISPLMGWLAWRIKIEDAGPFFYRGIRIGLNGKPFRIYKFRTMVLDADKIGPSSTSEDDPRITKIGRFLRAYKLDELPQLINVLLGDMSFVGPRPQVQWAVELYDDKEKVILSVRPGITDYASLLFSNEGEILKGSTDPDKDYMEKIHPLKTKLAMKYVNKHSLFVDTKIIMKTLTALFKNKIEINPG
jgi:lipopolysaccharide/colanic/teichoic acid biosynthesis glycosyltransferase